ncbi:hypothetical protein B0H13DRAFT_1873386 [Mycena leptocephala]|nr:hypothetical protein B0H13DRAFT_1873386 [Mycena leptocephala]
MPVEMRTRSGMVGSNVGFLFERGGIIICSGFGCLERVQDETKGTRTKRLPTSGEREHLTEVDKAMMGSNGKVDWIADRVLCGGMPVGRADAKAQAVGLVFRELKSVDEPETSMWMTLSAAQCEPS